MKKFLFLILSLALSFNSFAATRISDEPAPLELPEEPPAKIEYLGKFFITYYCSCGKCNGYFKETGKPRSVDGFGNPLKWGTVAVDKKIVPLYTKLYIEGYEGTTFQALDTGSHIDDYDIDIFVPVSHEEAIRMCKDKWHKVWRVIE